MSRRTTLASAVLLVSALGAGLAAVAPPAVAATSTPTVTAGTRLGVGAVEWPLTVTGTGLTATTKVTFTDTGTLVAAGAANTDVVQDTSVPGTVNAAGTSLTVIVNVSAKVSAEALDIVVTNSDGGTGTCYAGAFMTLDDTGCLTIDAAPSALKFTTNDVGIGAVGHATPFTATGLLAPPAGAPAKYSPALLSTSAAPFTATVSIAKDGDAGETASITVPSTTAADSTAPVILVNGDGGRETDGTLNLVAAPTLSSIIYNAGGDAGFDLTIQTVGGGFSTTTAPVVTFLGKNYTATQPMAQSFVVDLGVVPASTPGGRQAFTITNADGGTYVDNGSSAVTAPLTVVGAPAAPPAVTVSNVGDGTATISFSAVPTNSGGAPLSSYNVATTPDTGPHTVYLNQPLSYTLTGLTDGTSYTATVTATNLDPRTSIAQTGPGTVSAPFTPTGAAAAAPGAAALPPVAVQAPVVVPTVSLKASLKTVNFASPITISGTALLRGAPIVNTLVDLQTISAKGVRTDTGETTTTDSAGHFTFAKIYPSYSTTFGVGIANTTTAGIRVVVTQYLLLTKKTLATSRAYTITGLGTPGTTDKKAKVVLFKVTRTGHRVGTITSTYLARGKSAKGYSAGISTFTLKSTLKPGSYLVAVAILGTTTNGPVQTKPFTVKVP